MSTKKPVTVFKQTLLERYPGCTVNPVAWSKHTNVLRIRLRWQDKEINCIAKLISYITNPKPDIEWNKNADKGYNTEKKIYRRLPTWWPVHFVDGFHISNIGNVIIVTEFPGTCSWKDYVPTRAFDKKIAHQLYQQIKTLHDVGVRHNDFLVKNIVVNLKQHKISIIDFEKSVFTKSKESQSYDFVSLIADLNMDDNTRGIATQLIILLGNCKT